MTRLQEFETWIREGHGRCTSCGYAPRQQGHAPTCKRRGDPMKTPKDA